MVDDGVEVLPIATPDSGPRRRSTKQETTQDSYIVEDSEKGEGVQRRQGRASKGDDGHRHVKKWLHNILCNYCNIVYSCKLLPQIVALLATSTNNVASYVNQ